MSWCSALLCGKVRCPNIANENGVLGLFQGLPVLDEVDVITSQIHAPHFGQLVSHKQFLASLKVLLISAASASCDAGCVAQRLWAP